MIRRNVAARTDQGRRKLASDIDRRSRSNTITCKNTAANVDARPGRHAYRANAGLGTKCATRGDDIAAGRIRTVLRTMNTDVAGGFQEERAAIRKYDIGRLN